MPSSPAHRDQAQRNEQVMRDLLEAHPDWSTTAAFYAAVHLLECYAALRQQHFHSHAQRGDWLSRQMELREMARAYVRLQGYAQITRYACPPPSHELRDPRKVETQVFGELSQIKRCLDLAIRRLGAE